jgi:hypothetical protein
VYKLNVILGSDRIVKIWDTRISKNVQMIRDLNSQWGQITCAKFIIPDPGSKYICFGTG